MALRDAPDSFGETFADAAGRPASYWDELTRSVTVPGPQAMFLACEGEHLCGSTYALLDRERAETGRVGGMWVAPAWRRRGIGRALLQGVFDWALERRLRRLALWAPAHSPAALALYRQAGFRETGNSRPLPSNPVLQIIEMECDFRMTARLDGGTMTRT
jgi:GNAT superfamily N-acetyltransferase